MTDKQCDEKQELKSDSSKLAKHRHECSADSKHAARADSDSENDSTDVDDDDDDDDSDEHGAVEEINIQEIVERLGPMSHSHRRSVVSSYVTMDKAWVPPFYEKSERDAASIRKSVRQNLLFSEVSEETLQILVNAMKYVAVSKGDTVITQGEPGDLFYIVESGVCQVVVNGRAYGEVDGTSERNFFGELALLHDAPRAATIVALTDVECWSLDRVTFKRILMATTMQRRQLYLDFIDQVPIFSTLSNYEKMIVADALRVCYYEPDAVILQEGTAGDDFYIVEDGEVRCTKNDKEVSARLGSGDFFGELALVTDDHRMATVTAVRKTKCLVLDRQTFKRLLGPMKEHLRKRADLYDLYMNAFQSPR